MAGSLRSAGWAVTVPELSGAERDPSDVAGSFAAQLPLGEPLVLVPHSNAGLYVAGLAAGHPVVAVVFVDAGLPQPEETTPTAPPTLVAHLEGLADDRGVVPPWSQWWDPDDLEGLFPDRDTRDRVLAEQRRLPLSYFRSAVATPPGWESLPCAYLGFGDTYAEEQRAARGRGWPVTVTAGAHLQMLHDPDGVAAEIVRLLDVLELPAAPERAADDD